MADAFPPLTGNHAGSLFLVVAPSGAGKSTLVNALLAREPNVQLSVSYTTRHPRKGDKDGREYHFVSVEEFMQRRADGEFLESAEVHGNYYATSRKWIEERVRTGIDVLLEIDWQGARQVKSQFPHAVGIFILPPSFDALEARLHKRGQDTQPVIARRLLAAGSEMAHAPEFDYVIINEDIESAFAEVRAILAVERLKRERNRVRGHPRGQ